MLAYSDCRMSMMMHAWLLQRGLGSWYRKRAGIVEGGYQIRAAFPHLMGTRWTFYDAEDTFGGSEQRGKESLWDSNPIALETCFGGGDAKEMQRRW